jgi:hypothetical protein
MSFRSTYHRGVIYLDDARQIVLSHESNNEFGNEPYNRETKMRNSFVFGIGIMTALALNSGTAFAESKSQAERCKRNADICVKNSVKCSNPSKCEERCFFKWDLCDAGTPLPGASAQSISGSGPTQKSAIGSGNGATASVAAPISTSIKNGKPAPAATASTLNGASAVLSQPSVSLQTAPRFGASTNGGGGAQLNTAGSGSIRLRQQ